MKIVKIIYTRIFLYPVNLNGIKTGFKGFKTRLLTWRQLAILLLFLSTTAFARRENVNLAELRGLWKFKTAEFTTYKQGDSTPLETLRVDSVDKLASAGYPFGTVFKTIDVSTGKVKCTLGGNFGVAGMEYVLEGNILQPVDDGQHVRNGIKPDLLKNAMRPVALPDYVCSETAEGLMIVFSYPAFGSRKHDFPVEGKMLVTLVRYSGAIVEETQPAVPAYILDGENSSFALGRQFSSEKIAIGLTDEGVYELRNGVEIWLVERPASNDERIAKIITASLSGMLIFVGSDAFDEDNSRIFGKYNPATREVFDQADNLIASIHESAFVCPQGKKLMRFNKNMNTDESLLAFFLTLLKLEIRS